MKFQICMQLQIVCLHRKKLLMCPNSGEEFSVTTDAMSIEVEMIGPVRLSSLSNFFATNTSVGT